METELQKKVDHVKRDHPGYDEYNFTLAEISHNPFELAALLTVLYENYTPAQVQSMLQTIFDYQYKLTYEEIVETRTRIETRTGHKWVSDGEVDGVSTGHMESYEYEVEVEYEYYILNTTLTNNGIIAAVNGLNLTQEQMERYRLLLEMRGNKPEIFSDNVYANPGVSEEYERYAVPGEYLTDQQFANLLHKVDGPATIEEIEEKFILFREAAAMLKMTNEDLLTLIRKEKYKDLLEMRMFDNKRWISRRGFQDFLNLHDQYKIRQAKNESGNVIRKFLSQKQYISKEEAARIAGVSKSTVAKWALKGMFPCRAAGYVMRIERIPFLEWVDENRKVV